MPIQFEKPDSHPHVAIVTIDNPARANSLDLESLTALAAAWKQIDEDESIRVAVLTGAGDRVFCSGMDIKRTLPVSQALARGERVDPADFEALRSIGAATLAKGALRVPLLTAINGHARGGGFDLMLASQMRFSIPAATFALEEVALGLYPTGQATVALPRQIAAVHAAELLYTAQPIDADRALAMGLLNALVPGEELLDHTLAVADQIAANAPLAVQATLRGVRELDGMSLESAYRRQEELGRPLRKTADAREAQRAFVQKRPPRFEGH